MSMTSDFEVDFQLDYENSTRNQRNIINFDSDDIIDISNSRTFVYMKILKKLKIGLRVDH